MAHPARRRGVAILVVILLAVALWVNAESLQRRYYSQMAMEDLVARTDRSGNAIAVRVLAERYLRTNRAEAAVRLLTTYVERHPDDGHSWLLLGRAHFLLGQSREAYAALRMAEQLVGADADLLFLQGELLRQRDDEHGAATRYRLALDLDPKHFDSLLAVGRIHLVHVEYGAALENLYAARQAAPENTEVIELLCQAHLALGQADVAEGLAREGVKLAPTSGRSWYMLGEVLRASMEPQKRQEAEDAYHESLKVDPNMVFAYHELGALHFAKGEYQEAVRDFESILARMPLHKKSYPMLMQCYRRLQRHGDEQRATVAFERLDEIDLETAPLEYQVWVSPDDIELRLELAERYIRFERPDLAADQVTTALRFQSDHPGALAMRERLREMSP